MTPSKAAMKIQLQSLRVVNCGPLRDDCIQFNTIGESPTTVLAGANGSGKTTILKLIVALAGKVHSSTMDAVAEETTTLNRADYAQIDCMVSGQQLSIFQGYVWYGNIQNNHFGTSISAKTNVNATMRAANKRQSGGAVITDLRGGIKEQQDVPVTALSIRGRSTPSVLYFPLERSLLQTNGTSVVREDVQYEWVYKYKNARSFDTSLDSYLIWLEYAETDTYAKMIDFLDGLDFDGKKFGVQRRELRAIVTTRDGQTHGVAELSSGEQNILIMLLELRRRLLPYSIVLIDEIENSLHPAFQHRLGQALRKMQAEIPFQLIVTTHSPEFARIFGPESVRILTEF